MQRFHNEVSETLRGCRVPYGPDGSVSPFTADDNRLFTILSAKRIFSDWVRRTINVCNAKDFIDPVTSWKTHYALAIYYALLGKVRGGADISPSRRPSSLKLGFSVLARTGMRMFTSDPRGQSRSFTDRSCKRSKYPPVRLTGCSIWWVLRPLRPGKIADVQDCKHVEYGCCEI
jgi:hypothetical protein